MASKRPFQNNYTGNSNKRPKQDFNEFKAPTSSVLKPGSNINGGPYNSTSTGPSKKFPMPQQQSIRDQDDLFKDEDDEIFILASQNAEEEERRLNQERAQKAREMNMTSTDLSYSMFALPPATSTQNLNRLATQTGYTEAIRNNLFADLTGASQMAPRPSTSFNAPGPSQTQSSQKENISTSQTFTRQINQIRALEIQVKNHKTKTADLQEKLLVKDGETSNLRRDKRILEEKIKELKLQKLKDVEMKRENSEIDRLRKEIQRLKNENSFEAFNQSIVRTGPVEKTKIPLFTNLPKPLTSNAIYALSTCTFKQHEHLPKQIEFRINAIMDQVQRRIAYVLHLCTAGRVVDDSLLNSIFVEASQIILEIKNYIQYLEFGKEKKITFDNNPALSAYIQLSVACLREKLTSFNVFANTLQHHSGKLSIFQPGKLFNEEICDKPRRILAFYSDIARLSRKFSKRLLLEEFYHGNEDFQSFSTIWRDLLVNLVSESDKVIDYFGFVMASAKLLASLAVHYDEFEPNQVIDTSLLQLLRAILECRCDNPIIMKDISEFLFNVTKNAKKTWIASQLCVNFSKDDIDFSGMYNYSLYPQEACTFQLFTMYLLTAYKHNEDLNEFELKLLLQTSLNLNRITSNIQEMELGAVQFLQQNDEITLCRCLDSLIKALLKLNQLALYYRSIHLNQLGSSKGCTEETYKKDFNKNHALTAEVARSSVSMINDLFNRLDPDRFPIEKLVFANKLESMVHILKSGQCVDINNNRESCQNAFKLNMLNESLKSIDVSPNIQLDHDEEMDVDGNNDNDQAAVDICNEFTSKLFVEII